MAGNNECAFSLQSRFMKSKEPQDIAIQKGKIISTLENDKELNRAIEILLNSNGENEYETLLRGINN